MKISSQSPTRRNLLVLCYVLAAPSLGHANDEWPTRPVRIIVPSLPASPADAVLRSLEDLLAKQLGKPVVLENKAGAQGSIGLEAVARAAPDGYTFGLLNMQGVAATTLRKQIPYNLNKSFEPVTQLTFESPVLIVSAKVQAQTLQELIKLLKAKGSEMTYASAGSGTPSHLGMELLKRSIGSEVLHVPYKGAGPASVDVAGGQANLALVGSNVAIQLVKGGRVRALAVSSDHRLPSLPAVPTFSEAGVKGLDLRGWVGLVAPAGTNAGIVAKMQHAMKAILQTPVAKARIEATGSTPTSSTPSEFGHFIASEAARWHKAVTEANIKFE